MRRRQFAAGLHLVAAGLGGASRAHAAPMRRSSRVQREGALVVGDTPPPLAIARVAGTDPTTLASLTGRVVVLSFWATWSSPSCSIMPPLDRMYRRHRGQGLSVIGIARESERDIRARLGANPVGYTIAREVGGVSRSYHMRIPTLAVLGRAGKVRALIVRIDAAGVQRLDGLVQRLLAEPV